MTAPWRMDRSFSLSHTSGASLAHTCTQWWTVESSMPNWSPVRSFIRVVVALIKVDSLLIIAATAAAGARKNRMFGA